MATKFPVTYRGEQYRVVVKEYEDTVGYLTLSRLHVSVYEKRTGMLAKLFPLSKIYELTFNRDNDVVEAVEYAVKRCYLSYVSKRKQANAKTRKWAKFTEWDGGVSD